MTGTMVTPEEAKTVSVHRVAARTAGVLLIAGVLTSVIGTSLLGTSFNETASLSQVAAHENRLLASALLQIATAAGAPLIALCFFLALRSEQTGLATGALVSRSIEAVFASMSALVLICIVAVAGLSEAGGILHEVLFAVARTVRDASHYVFGVIWYGFAAMMYNAAFYRTRLIPRPLAVWGFLGALLIQATAVVTLVNGEPYAIEGRLALLALPIAVQEVVLAIWLLARGFRISTVQSAANP